MFPLVYVCTRVTIALQGVLTRYLNSVTCGSWTYCILTLTNDVPFRHMYSAFALDTSIPLFFEASIHCSSSNSRTSFSLAHSTPSSVNIICQGDSFLMFSGVFHCVFDYHSMCRRLRQSWLIGYLCRLMFEEFLHLRTRLSQLACGPNCLRVPGFAAAFRRWGS